jgi:hypothetical protein
LGEKERDVLVNRAAAFTFTLLEDNFNQFQSF